ncbi:effector binding domain-containing protein [Paenibacillus sp. FSL W8-0187]|uniref:GyrI-like domain-containing protein n=1 Tax=Paenibacillus sp. FSL W8-0187 TaxID=2921710 RepID=UPI0030DD4754
MVTVRIEKKPSFKICGRKTWVGQDNEAFGQFWEKCRKEGLIQLFERIHENRTETVTNSNAIGVSCVEKDPNDRNFWFYVATECDHSPEGFDLEEYTIPASEWVIFENYGETPDALIEAEMYAFEEWLPYSRYNHANIPEIEAYPPRKTDKGFSYEFWLPIIEKEVLIEIE